MKQLMAIGTGFALSLLISAGTGSAVPHPHPGQPDWIAGYQGQSHGNHGHGNDGEEHGHGHSKGAPKSVAFSGHERDVIQGYFREYPSDLPPGLAKRGGDLPPGLEKQLRVNGTLPPGLEKKLRPCPVRLNRELPPLPSGYSRMMLGGQMLILDRSNVIVDMAFLFR